MIITGIIAGVLTTAILGLLAGMIFIGRYVEKLTWIRDRVDVTTEEGREILWYINDELDSLYGIRSRARKRINKRNTD